MLLRRVMKHVRDQNWFAVGIDFLIVVTGVFIGIQVSNWNEVRKEGADRQLYRAQLIGDLEEIERRASRETQQYVDRAPDLFGFDIYRAPFELMTGDTEGTLRAIERMVDRHETYSAWITADRMIVAALGDDPRFQALVARVGLPAR